jgi:hypothetical protein
MSRDQNRGIKRNPHFLCKTSKTSSSVLTDELLLRDPLQSVITVRFRVRKKGAIAA